MIGLKRGAVKLLLYNPKWKESFEKEKRRLQKVLGDLVISIEHVGSTSVPGVSAKPIIDIAIVVKSIKSSDKFTKLLQGLGYQYKQDDNVPGRLFFTKGSENKRTHYIHIIELGGKEWKNLILFRDYLLSHKQAVIAYNKLKNKLAEDYSSDRKSYTSGKNDLIGSIIKKAEESRHE